MCPGCHPSLYYIGLSDMDSLLSAWTVAPGLEHMYRTSRKKTLRPLPLFQKSLKICGSRSNLGCSGKLTNHILRYVESGERRANLFLLLPDVYSLSKVYLPRLAYYVLPMYHLFLHYSRWGYPAGPRLGEMPHHCVNEPSTSVASHLPDLPKYRLAVFRKEPGYGTGNYVCPTKATGQGVIA